MAKCFTIKDDHNDNSISSTVWTTPAWGGAQVAETNNQLEITSTLASGYYGLDTPQSHDLTSSRFVAQIVGCTSSSIPSLEMYILLSTDGTGNNQLLWLASPYNNNISAYKKIAGVSTWVGQLTYTTYVGVAGQSLYCGFEERNGTTYFVYSLGGRVWRELYSESNPLTYTSVRMGYMIGTWQAEASTGIAQFDNLNFLKRRIN